MSFFTLMNFSVPNSHAGNHIAFNNHISLGYSWFWQFLRLSLFLMTLIVLKSSDQAIRRILFNCDLTDVFLMIRLELKVLEMKTTEVKYHPNHIMSRVHAISMTYHCQCWPWSQTKTEKAIYTYIFFFPLSLFVFFFSFLWCHWEE